MEDLYRWDCQTDRGHSSYSIIPFEGGKYYGLFICYTFPDDDMSMTEFNLEHTGYMYNSGIFKVIGCALVSAQGLPDEAQFKSVLECKKYISETCSEYLEWKRSIL
jgi:hypothetical protein